MNFNSWCKVAMIDFLPTVVHYDKYLISSVVKILPNFEFITRGHSIERNYFKELEKNVKIKYINKFSRNLNHKFLRQLLTLLEYLMIDFPCLLIHLKKNKFKIIHFQLLYLIPNFVDLMLMLFAKFMGIRTIYTAHNVLPHNYKGDKFNYLFYKLVYKMVDQIITHTDDMKRRIISLFDISPHKIEVIPHGPLFYDVNTMNTKNKARKKLGLNSQDKVILFQGLISPYKGVEYLIRAFPDIYKEEPKAKLLIAGCGKRGYIKSLEEEIRGVCLRHNIPESAVIYRFDYIPTSELPLYFLSSDIVVLPYTEASQSGVLLTAYSFSKPVVCSNIGGFKEAVNNGVNGYLVRPKDPKSIATAVLSILKDKNRLENMGYNSYKLATEKFSWRTISQKTVKLYENLLAK